MPITEEVRHRIYETFRASFGDEVANGLMEMFPPVGWADVATNHDVVRELSIVDARVGQRIEVLRGEVHQLRGDFHQGLREQTNRFLAWMFAVAGLGIAVSNTLARVG